VHEVIPLKMVALIPVILIGAGFVMFCLVDLAKAQVRYLPKWAWGLICLVSVPLGGVIYFAVGRRPQDQS
jgi:hypothetical protein